MHNAHAYEMDHCSIVALKWLLSGLAFARMGFCPGGLCPGGICPGVLLSGWAFVRHIYPTIFYPGGVFSIGLQYC